MEIKYALLHFLGSYNWRFVRLPCRSVLLRNENQETRMSGKDS